MNATLEHFAGMIAHELRNPLASATTNIAVVRELSEEGDPRAPFLKQAEKEMLRIRDLLKSCLDFATAGKVSQKTSDLSHLLNSVANKARKSHSNLSVEVVIEGDSLVQVDELLFQRAVANLCENAAKAMKGSGNLKILFRGEEDHFFVQVEDSGPGLPEDIFDRMFEPFITGSNSSGLGLPFVKKIVEAHGGKVAPASSSLGGACFQIRIPKKQGL
jgi:signal transduction histidine kinase